MSNRRPLWIENDKNPYIIVNLDNIKGISRDTTHTVKSGHNEAYIINFIVSEKGMLFWEFETEDERDEVYKGIKSITGCIYKYYV